MARKTRGRRASTVIEKSLRDAQKVLSSYMESGGKQVKDTLGSLAKIFENHQLADALGSSKTSRRQGAAKRRTGSARRATASRGNAAKATSATRAAAKPRTAAARTASAKRTTRTPRRK